MKTGLFAFMFVALVGTVGSPGAAQGQAEPSTDGGPGWLAWFGCWGSSGGTVQGETICVLPGDDALSARFVTIENGSVAQETTIHADGVGRPVQEGGCSGDQTAFFSSDGRRVFTRSDLSCSNAPRVTTGVLGFVAPNRWVDSQALTVRDQHAARSVLYEAVGAAGIPDEVSAALPGTFRLAQEAVRLDASARIGLEAVVEAHSNLAPPALDGFLAAGEQGFDLDASMLRSLRRAGVPPSSIDVMVALSYPERFAVRERDFDAEAAPDRVVMRDAFMQDYCYDPFWVGRYGDCFNSFGYGSRYGRFGYSPYGYDPYGWRYSRSPVFVIVEPETEGRGGTVDRTRGYTPAGAATGSAAPRSGGATQTSTPSAAPRTSSGPSSSGGPSSGGYAPSGGNSGDSGSTRTARPRDSGE